MYVCVCVYIYMYTYCLVTILFFNSQFSLFVVQYFLVYNMPVSFVAIIHHLFATCASTYCLSFVMFSLSKRRCRCVSVYSMQLPILSISLLSLSLLIVVYCITVFYVISYFLCACFICLFVHPPLVHLRICVFKQHIICYLRVCSFIYIYIYIYQFTYDFVQSCLFLCVSCAYLYIRLSCI